jgi:hypothetical protein
MNSQWYKIVNLNPPKIKYFLYPHLLMLHQHHSSGYPLNFLGTCENKSLDEFTNITKEFILDENL